jgi:hypothetical protein
MKKIAIFLFAGLLSLSLNTAIANCGAGCKCKDKCDGKKACTSCKKEETKAKHVCNKECMKDGKCAEMKKETKGKGKG